MKHNPNYQQKFTMVLYLNTEDIPPRINNTLDPLIDYECCPTQINNLIVDYFGKTPKKPNEYAKTQLLLKGLIQCTRREKYEHSVYHRRGKRSYFRLTPSGKKEAELLLRQFSHCLEISTTDFYPEISVDSSDIGLYAT